MIGARALLVVAALVAAAPVVLHAQAPAELTPAGTDSLTPPAREPGPLPRSVSIPPAELEAFVDGVVRLGMDQANIAGAAVAIVQDGRAVLTKGYGFASFDPERRVDPGTTMFRIGSITKTFTWIALMRAVEAGKIELDAPVNQYLPAELQLPDDGFQKQVRVRDLMTHAAGLEDRVFGVLFTREPESVVRLDTFLERYRPKRVREPGLFSSYSNYGVGLAGALVAEVEGLEWEVLIERDILWPLGLTHTTGREPYPARDDLPTPLAPELASELSNAFRWNGLTHEVRSFEHIAQVAPAGAMSASAADMARYMLMLLGDGTLDGVTIFGPTAARTFRTPMSSLPPEVGTLDGGFWDSPLPGGVRGYGHGGATLSFFSDMVVVPELRLGVFSTTNTEGGAQLTGGLAYRVIEHFYGPAREAPPRESFDAAEQRRIYAGQYVATRRRYSGLEGFIFRLQGGINVGVAPDGFLIVGGALGPPARYVPTETPDTFRSVSGRPNALKFVRNGTRATRVDTQVIGFERVGFLYRNGTLMVPAVCALLVSLAVVIGGFLRLASKPPATPRQKLAGRVQLATAVLWLVSLAALAAWAASASNVVNIIYVWPGPMILASSTAALVASLLTLVGVALLPSVWRADDAGASWSRWRRLRYTLALASFATLALVLAAWGALQPWAP